MNTARTKSSVIQLFALLIAVFTACSSPSEGQRTEKENPHFEHSEAFYYHWAPGIPGPRGTNYIFEFLPGEDEEPTFQKVKLKGEAKTPDISRRGDTLVLMIQERSMTSSGKDEEKVAKQASIIYSLEGVEHEHRVERIPRKKEKKKTPHQ